MYDHVCNIIIYIYIYVYMLWQKQKTFADGLIWKVASPAPKTAGGSSTAVESVGAPVSNDPRSLKRKLWRENTTESRCHGATLIDLFLRLSERHGDSERACPMSNDLSDRNIWRCWMPSRFYARGNKLLCPFSFLLAWTILTNFGHAVNLIPQPTEPPFLASPRQ